MPYLAGGLENDYIDHFLLQGTRLVMAESVLAPQIAATSASTTPPLTPGRDVMYFNVVVGQLSLFNHQPILVGHIMNFQSIFLQTKSVSFRPLKAFTKPLVPKHCASPPEAKVSLAMNADVSSLEK